jgi:hypothetical protein
MAEEWQNPSDTGDRDRTNEEQVRGDVEQEEDFDEDEDDLEEEDDDETTF